MGVDLHLHSTVSDGTLTPTEIIEKAAALELSTVSITDHDSFAGINEAKAAAERHGVCLIPGVELSTNFSDQDVHVLGYFADYLDPALNEKLRGLRDSREIRARQIVERLSGIGVDIDWDMVMTLSRGEAVGRPHIAQALINEGYARDMSDVFKRYLGRDKPGYLQKRVLDIREIFHLVHRAGGLTSLAHPGHWQPSEAVLTELKTMGLDAIEAWHIDHSEADTARFLGLAQRLGLLLTGGSDCHGERKKHGHVLGSLDIPDAIVEPLRIRADEIRSAPMPN